MKIPQHLVVIDQYPIMSMERYYTLLGVSKVYHKGDAIVWMRSERKRSSSQGNLTRRGTSSRFSLVSM
jgi:hypothetical protein